MRGADVKKSEAKDRLHRGASGNVCWGASVRASSTVMRADVSAMWTFFLSPVGIRLQRSRIASPVGIRLQRSRIAPPVGRRLGGPLQVASLL